MTATTMPTAILMRPVASADDSFAAGELLTEFIGEEPWKLDELVPGGETFNAVAIAEDGSAAEFEVYAGTDWSATDTTPIARLILRR